MSRFSHAVFMVIVVLGVSTVKVASAAAQEPPPGQSPAELKKLCGNHPRIRHQV